MQWFKFYGAEYLIDPKMQSLTAQERSCWLTLLCYACAAEDNGRVRHLSEDRLILAAGVDPVQDDSVTGIVDKFVSLDMVLRDSNGDITVKNWNKRQNSYLTNAERQARYRERQKSNANVTPLSQQSNARESRIEREKEKNTSNDEGEIKDRLRIAKRIAKDKESLLRKKTL